MAWYDRQQNGQMNQNWQSNTQQPMQGYPTQQSSRNNWDQPTSPMASLGSVMNGTNTRQVPSVTYSFPGRPVSGEEEIKANEVPMDGTLCLFPKKDLSVIYAKAWNAQGTIDTVSYIPQKRDVPKEPDPYQQEILNRLTSLEAFLQQNFNNRNCNNNNNQRNKQPPPPKPPVQEEGS